MSAFGGKADIGPGDARPASAGQRPQDGDRGIGAIGAVPGRRPSIARVVSGRLDLLLLIWLLFAMAVLGMVVVGMVASRFI